MMARVRPASSSRAWRARLPGNFPRRSVWALVILCALTVVDREQGGQAEIEKQGVKFLTLTTLGKVQAAK